MKYSAGMLIKVGMVVIVISLLMVMMVSSLGGPASAAFNAYRPNLGISLNNVYWGSYADYLDRNLTVVYQMNNGAGADAANVHVTGAAANNGVSLATAMPLSVGDIATGASAQASVVFNVPAGVATFSTNVTGDAEKAGGGTYNYPLDPLDLVYAEGTAGIPVITVIDTSSMTVVNELWEDTLTSGQSHRNQISPDGKYIWNGEGGTTGYVQVLDAATGAQVKQWNVGSHNGPTMSNWTKDGHHYLFFPTGTGAAGVINIFDVEAQEFVGAIPVGESPNHMWDTTPDGSMLWGTVGSGTTSRAVAYDITHINHGEIPTTKSAEVTIGGSLHALAVDLIRPRVYVGSSTGGVNVIDTTTNTVSLWKAGGIASSHNFTPSPDGAYLLVGESNTYGCDSTVYGDIPHDGTRGPFLWGLNLETLTVDKYFEGRDGAGNQIGRPSHQTFTSDGSHLLMSSTTPGLSAVFVLDPDTLALQTYIPVSGNPHAIGIPGGDAGAGGTTY